MDWKSLGGVKYRAHYICDEWVCTFCFLWNMVYVKTWNLTWNSFVSYRGSKKSCYKIQTDLKFQSSVISSSSRMSWPYLQSKYCLSILLFITIKTYDFEFSDVSHSACLEIKRQQCTNLNWAQVELLLTLHSQGGCEEKLMMKIPGDCLVDNTLWWGRFGQGRYKPQQICRRERWNWIKFQMKTNFFWQIANQLNMTICQPESFSQLQTMPSLFDAKAGFIFNSSTDQVLVLVAYATLAFYQMLMFSYI